MSSAEKTATNIWDALKDCMEPEEITALVVFSCARMEPGSEFLSRWGVSCVEELSQDERRELCRSLIREFEQLMQE